MLQKDGVFSTFFVGDVAGSSEICYGLLSQISPRGLYSEGILKIVEEFVPPYQTRLGRIKGWKAASKVESIGIHH